MSETERQTLDGNCTDQCNSTQTPSGPGQLIGYDGTETTQTPSGPGQMIGYSGIEITPDLNNDSKHDSPNLSSPGGSFSSTFLDLLAAPFGFVAKSFNYVGNSLYYYLATPLDYLAKPFNFLAKHFSYLAKSIANFGR